MIDLYLRTETEAEMKTALAFATDADGAWSPYTPAYALDLIGPVETVPGVFDADGNAIAAPEVDHRFHANLRLLDQSLAEQVPEAVRIPVNNPRRVWA